MANVKEVTDGAFKSEVLDSKTPVLVDFWAPWCGPCRAIAPLVEELSGLYGAKLKVLKMNVDDNYEIPGQLGIRSIPTLKLFVNGAEVNQTVGSTSIDQLKKFVEPHVK